MKINNQIFRKAAQSIVGRIAIGSAVGAGVGITAGFAIGATLLGSPYGALASGVIYGISGAISGAISAINVRRDMSFMFLEGMAGGIPTLLMEKYSGLMNAHTASVLLVPTTAASLASRLALRALLVPRSPA